MEFLSTIILGILQGITEFLPISSSAHLIIFSNLLDGKPLPLAINVALHVGTFGAVIVYFWRDWLRLIDKSFNGIVKKEKSFEFNFLLPALIIGTIPAGLVGFFFADKIEQILHQDAVVIAPLIIVGVLLWWTDSKKKSVRELHDLKLKDAVIIGLFQALALIPGVSRSGATILGGRMLQFKKEDAAKFSFLLGTPAMFGAALLKSSEIIQSMDDPNFYIGIIASLITGCLAIKFLLSFIQKYGFGPFAIYRIILALLILGKVVFN